MTTSQERYEALRAARPHFTLAELAAKWGLTRQRVHQILAGSAPPASVSRGERNARIRERVASGERVRDVAASLGLSAVTIYRILKKRA